MKVTSHTLVTSYIYDNYYIFLKFCQIIIFRNKIRVIMFPNKKKKKKIVIIFMHSHQGNQLAWIKY